MIHADTLEKIRAVPHFAASGYADLDLAATLEFFDRRSVQPLVRGGHLKPGSRILDAETGYGWLSMALARGTDSLVVALESDRHRLEAGREIARLLEIDSQVTWLVGDLTAIDAPDIDFDWSVCVEVLEHVQRDVRAAQELARVTRSGILLTTPNQWFPAVAHYTRLPLAHWLPPHPRSLYATLSGRRDQDAGNLFWSPRTLMQALEGFRRESEFLQFESLDQYLRTFPCYYPYNGGQWHRGLGRWQEGWYRLAAMSPWTSKWYPPSLTGLYVREHELAMVGLVEEAGLSRSAKGSIDRKEALA